MSVRADKQGTLIDSGDDVQKQVECLGLTFESEEARRAYFTEILREKLRDPEFRKIEGFPIGEDEDILALSDPPYYTACPNPFLEDFIRIYGKPYNPDEPYNKEPLAMDIQEGKGDRNYYIHTYHTKVPPTAISKYLDYYTSGDEIVMDCFAGSGMTAVGSTLVKDKNLAVILVDLGVAAGFISYFHSLFRPTQAQARLVADALAEAQRKFGELYTTAHNGWPASGDAPVEPSYSVHGNGLTGRIKYTVWSDIVRCPSCSYEMSLWDASVTLHKNEVANPFPCPSCKSVLTKEVKGAKEKGRSLVERVLETVVDDALGVPVQRTKRVPVLISYEYNRSRFEKIPDQDDLARIRQAEDLSIANWFPTEEIPEGDKTGDPKRAGITHVHQYFPRRTLHVLSLLAERLRPEPGLIGFVTALLTRCSWQNRYMPQHRGNRSREVVGPLSGTLYIPPFALEINPIEYGAEKSRDILRQFGKVKKAKTIISTQSAATLRNHLESCVDYVFIDPPFGSNLQYSELSFVIESWLRVVTNNETELVVNQTRNAALHNYGAGMQQVFGAVCRALKPGRWVTIEFHNSQNAVWNAIQNAVLEAALIVADVRVLDKMKGTTKQLTQANSVQQDLIITAYRPDREAERQFDLTVGTEEGVWHFVRAHLAQLPTFVLNGGRAEILTERMDYLLFDRMVAFHVQRGVAVPISASEFYAGLSRRFPTRDGMYFLPEQVAEYDKQRMTVKEMGQLELIPRDEDSAIKWLRQQLHSKPQTFQELTPNFMKIAGWSKHEKSLELSEILEQNFLRYDGQGDVPNQIHSYLSTNFKELRNLPKDDAALRAKAKDRWYVPDPNKLGDLERIREKALFREFASYIESSQKKLKVFRLEAVRAGFQRAWQQREYETIIQIARKLPETVLQEDPILLRFYDNALMRTGNVE